MRRAASILAAVVVFTGDGLRQHGRRPGEKVLYDRLGGKGAIQAVVDDFIGKNVARPRSNAIANANIPRLRTQLGDQICEGDGRPVQVHGREHVDAHRGMNVTETEFNALVERLVRSLDKFKVPAPRRPSS